ncbi:hypothetical protein ACI2IP_13270 [Microbacterium sp. NPDC090218]
MSTNNEIEPAGVRRLREARAALAARRAEPETEGVPVVQAGDEIHCTDPGGILLPRSTSVFGGEPGMQLFRGDTVTVQRSWIEASRDGSGQLTWPTLVHDPDEQVRRWGRVRLAPGPFPEEASRYERGTPDWAEAREQARKAAWAEPNAERRAAALAEVAREFGPPPVTSTIVSTTPDPSIKRAAEQRAALDAGGVRHVNRYEAQEPGVKR